MDDTKKMLQVLINGQTAIKQELSVKIDKLGEKLAGRIDSLEARVDELEKNLTERINRIGKQLAY